MYQTVRGMRDFYPNEYEKLNYIFKVWNEISTEYGFRRYDACIVESLELLKRKAGEEITDQIYHFQDKSGRNLALRPEMTPTLARLIIADKSLQFPLKWYSIPQCFRYERMTKGRKREHYQWNVDIIGEKSVIAEAEILAIAINALERFGFDKDKIVVKFNSREVMQEIFRIYDLSENEVMTAFMVLDKFNKVSFDDIQAMLIEHEFSQIKIDRIMKLFNINTFEQVEALIEGSDVLNKIQQFRSYLDFFKISEYVKYDISVVRGLSYYTGIVFEVFDTKGEHRAILGGGRYDNLISSLGGTFTPAVGFGFGDVVLGNLISEYNLWQTNELLVDYYICSTNESYLSIGVKISNNLRQLGYKVYLDYSVAKMSKLLAKASNYRASHCIILDERDIENNKIMIKNLNTRETIFKDINSF